MDGVYERLAKHLDALPAGFPSTDTGVELRILRRLFTPEEAETAMGLRFALEPVSVIAERLKRPAEGLEPTLDRMVGKGLIAKSTRKGSARYMAAQFMIGIWEYNVNNLSREFVADWQAYSPILAAEWSKRKTQQLRTIPVGESLPAGMEILPYDQAERIIEEQTKIVAAPCICRTEHRIAGKGCDKPLGNCLIFGGSAYLYLERGIGQEISKADALKIVKEGVEAGLVLQPGNMVKPLNICLCCGCCCQILKTLKASDKPARAANTSYFAEVSEADCTACGVCEDRCQMEALSIGETATVDLDRCIGCGLCINACEADAVYLVPKIPAEKWTPPKSLPDLYARIVKERASDG